MWQFLKTAGGKITVFCLLMAAFVGWNHYRLREKPLFMGISSGVNSAEFLNSSTWTTYSTENYDLHKSMIFEDISFKSFSGTVKVEFYEDELMSVTFSPKKYDVFVRYLLGPGHKNPRHFAFTRSGVSVSGYADENVAEVTWRDAARYSDYMRDDLFNF